MRITDITCHVVHGEGRNLLFVKTETDAGIVGWGEAFSVGPDLATAAVIEYLATWLKGEDPRDIERLWAAMYQWNRFPFGSIGMAAISGIDHSLWDISAQAAGVPVYELLGGRVRDRVRVYQGVGQDPDLAVALIKERGYTALKARPLARDQASRPWGENLRGAAKTMEDLRRAVGDDIQIGLDIHTNVFEPVRALELAYAVAPYNPFFLEEPVRPENVAEMALLRRKFPAPLATGESLFGKWAFNDLLKAQAADIIQPDITVCGGLTEMWKIAAIAEGHDVVVAPHHTVGPIATAANLHFAAATDNFLVLEFTPNDSGRRREFVKDPWIPRDGHLEVPETPGWGVELNEDALQRHSYEPWHRGHPRRPDGSPAFV
jgi:galactonate dehydratase